ncbi:MAG TPA: hypothetical protein VF432_03925 [Thermoanaerobaculia bacterium]
MTSNDPAVFHKLYGAKKPRVTYYKRDFLDYTVMIALTALALGLSYGPRHPVAIAGYALCAYALAMFATRHGVELTVPLIVRRPQDVLYMLVYKLQNLKPMYFLALGVLLLENVLIAATPNLPHYVGTMRKVGTVLFFAHLLALVAYRTVILVAHLRKKELVREVLAQTAWKRVVNEKTNVTLEILHAYTTGLLTHLVLLAPWYLVIRYASFSAIFLPVTCAISVFIHLKWWLNYNKWFYRDHWLGHNSELEFIYLHGTHHDAIPSALIAVAENGFLEGYMRFAAGWPVAFYNPIVCFLVTTFDVKKDIEMHQYIPGIYPRIPMGMMESLQHSTHHYGSIEPYGVGVKIDRPGVSEAFKKAFARIPEGLKNSAKLDEELNGFKWDNPTHRRILDLFRKYHVAQKE